MLASSSIVDYITTNITTNITTDNKYVRILRLSWTWSADVSKLLNRGSIVPVACYTFQKTNLIFFVVELVELVLFNSGFIVPVACYTFEFFLWNSKILLLKKLIFF